MSAPGPAYDGHSAGWPRGVPPGAVGAQEAGRGGHDGGCVPRHVPSMAPEHPCPTHPPTPGLSTHLGTGGAFQGTRNQTTGMWREGTPAVPADPGPPARKRSSRCPWPLGSLESTAHPPQPNLPAVVHAPGRASEITRLSEQVRTPPSRGGLGGTGASRPGRIRNRDRKNAEGLCWLWVAASVPPRKPRSGLKATPSLWASVVLPKTLLNFH